MSAHMVDGNKFLPPLVPLAEQQALLDFWFFTVVKIKIAALWDMTPCILVHKSQCLRATCCLHFPLSVREGCRPFRNFRTCLQIRMALTFFVSAGWRRQSCWSSCYNQNMVSPFLESRIGCYIVWTEIGVSYIQCVIGGTTAWSTNCNFTMNNSKQQACCSRVWKW